MPHDDAPPRSDSSYDEFSDEWEPHVEEKRGPVRGGGGMQANRKDSGSESTGSYDDGDVLDVEAYHDYHALPNKRAVVPKKREVVLQGVQSVYLIDTSIAEEAATLHLANELTDGWAH